MIAMQITFMTSNCAPDFAQLRPRNISGFEIILKPSNQFRWSKSPDESILSYGSLSFRCASGPISSATSKIGLHFRVTQPKNVIKCAEIGVVLPSSIDKGSMAMIGPTSTACGHFSVFPILDFRLNGPLFR